MAALAVRTTADPSTIAASLRTIIRDLDPQLAVPAIRTMDDIVDTSVAGRRFQMTLVMLLALAALVLAGLGIYGVVSQAVSQRTSEFGIRMALGANATSIRRLVVRQGLMPVLAGLAVGIVGAMGVSRFLQSLLFGVTPTDPIPLAAAALFLLSVATLASLVPAWRASRLDPMRALRVN
jgi:ABC-type antimicrobial peptide transport system permease subunit